MKASVVVITYDRSQIIGRCLDSLERQTVKPNRIIVIDSSENDETEKIVRDRNIVYKHVRKRLYQPQARNLALEMVGDPIVAFLDDDCICTPEWMENIIQGYTGGRIVGVFGPIIEQTKDLHLLEEAKNYTSSKPILRKSMYGGNMSFITQKLKEINGFDEFYGAYDGLMEDEDPLIALVMQGYRFRYMPKALVYHLKFMSGGARSKNQADPFYKYNPDYYRWIGLCRKHIIAKYFSKHLIPGQLLWIIYNLQTHLPDVLTLPFVRKDQILIEYLKGLFHTIFGTYRQ